MFVKLGSVKLTNVKLVVGEFDGIEEGTVRTVGVVVGTVGVVVGTVGAVVGTVGVAVGTVATVDADGR